MLFIYDKDISKAELVSLIKRYKYYPITVMFDGDAAVIYDRFVKRDQTPARHRGHVVNTKYPEIGPAPQYVPMGLNTFKEKIDKRGWRRFDVGGTRIVVDTTDLSKINYDNVVAQINKTISEHK